MIKSYNMALRAESLQTIELPLGQVSPADISVGDVIGGRFHYLLGRQIREDQAEVELPVELVGVEESGKFVYGLNLDPRDEKVKRLIYVTEEELFHDRGAEVFRFNSLVARLDPDRSEPYTHINGIKTAPYEPPPRDAAVLIFQPTASVRIQGANGVIEGFPEPKINGVEMYGRRVDGVAHKRSWAGKVSAVVHAVKQRVFAHTKKTT